MDPARCDPAYIERAYWLVLNRPPSALELRDQTSISSNSDQCALPYGLLHSSEFRRLRHAWKRGIETHPDPAALEALLVSIGSIETFVIRAYESILGRPPDEGGRRHYSLVLASGERRTNVARALAISAEFDEKRRAVPCDTQLCELANPAKWENEEWLDLLRSLGLTDDKLLMHRKPYEFTQLLYGCRRLEMLHEDASFISVGAGHEQVLYWLANHVQRVVATDLYEGAWQAQLAKEGDPAVLDDPDQYAPFPYRREHLVFMKMDGRHLDFPDGTFDVSYSLSSIEHFGGYQGARQTIREMARVLKPGGVLALATEYVISGPPHEETFQPREVHALLRESGLELVEPVDESVYRRYETRPVNIRLEPHRTPHMVVEMDGTVFTSVMAFLRKPPSQLTAGRP
jgi:SAM-dependent methyltransferase